MPSIIDNNIIDPKGSDCISSDIIDVVQLGGSSGFLGTYDHTMTSAEGVESKGLWAVGWDAVTGPIGSVDTQVPRFYDWDSGDGLPSGVWWYGPDDDDTLSGTVYAQVTHATDLDAGFTTLRIYDSAGVEVASYDRSARTTYQYFAGAHRQWAWGSSDQDNPFAADHDGQYEIRWT